MEGAELYLRPDRMIGASPTNDDQVVTILFWPHAEFARVRADIEGHFLQALELAPGLRERLRAATRVDRFRGTSQLPNFHRRPYGEGWALVGDAGYHKDPILALGISDAFRDAELLADAVDAGLAGRSALEPALAAYEARRNESAATPARSTSLVCSRLMRRCSSCSRPCATTSARPTGSSAPSSAPCTRRCSSRPRNLAGIGGTAAAAAA